MTKTKLVAALSVALLLVSTGSAIAGKKGESRKDKKLQEKREKIDTMARETLDHLFKDSSKAKELYDRSYGYAVFDNTRVTFGLTGGGGHGVAVEKDNGERTYMRMGTAGLAVGIGAQVYQVVFLFQDQKTFHNFVEKGWKAEGSANAVAGKAGANAEANFTNGMAVYELTDAGLMLQADISGTKYWKNDNLNK